MKRIVCGFFAMLASVAPAAHGQGQRHLDANAPGSRQSWLADDSPAIRRMMMNGLSVQPVLPRAPGGKVSVDTLEIPEAARKEMQECAKNSEAGKLQDSVKHAEKALRIYPQWAAAHQDLGQIFARMRQYQAAIAEFHIAAALDARMVEPWVSLASAYFLEEQYAEGEKAARRALEIDLLNPTARYLLGRILTARGDYGPEVIEQLRASGTRFPAARLVLAALLLKHQAIEEAAAELRAYLQQPEAPQKEKVACLVEMLTEPTRISGCQLE